MDKLKVNGNINLHTMPHRGFKAPDSEYSPQQIPDRPNCTYKSWTPSSGSQVWIGTPSFRGESGNSTTFRKGLTGFVDTPKYGSVTWILTTSSNMLYQSSRTTSSRIYSPISTLKPSLKDLAASSSMILTSPIEHSCKYQKRICLCCWEAWALFWVPTESKTARPNTASIGGHCVGSHLIHILCCLSPVLSIHLQILECC